MTKSQTYDAGTVLPACRAVLTKLRETERPGEGERLRKRNVLEALRPEITAMFRDGYTVRQVAAALGAAGTLLVRPKTITEVCGGPEQPPAQGRLATPRTRKRKAPPDTAAGDNATPVPSPRGRETGEYGPPDDPGRAETGTAAPPTAPHEPNLAVTTPSATTPVTGTITDRSTFSIRPDTDNL